MLNFRKVVHDMSLEDRKYVVLNKVEEKQWCCVCGDKGTMLSINWYCNHHSWIGLEIYEKHQKQSHEQQN